MAGDLAGGYEEVRSKVFLPSFSVLLVASLATAVHSLELQQSPGHPSCGSQLPESSHHCGFLSLST